MTFLEYFKVLLFFLKKITTLPKIFSMFYGFSNNYFQEKNSAVFATKHAFYLQAHTQKFTVIELHLIRLGTIDAFLFISKQDVRFCLRFLNFVRLNFYHGSAVYITWVWLSTARYGRSSFNARTCFATLMTIIGIGVCTMLRNSAYQQNSGTTWIARRSSFSPSQF